MLLVKNYPSSELGEKGSHLFCVQVEEGWWNGLFNGKSGLFPSNFVKELDATGEDGESNDTAADETGKTETEKQQGLVNVTDGV